MGCSTSLCRAVRTKSMCFSTKVPQARPSLVSRSSWGVEIKGPIAMVVDLNRDGDDDLLVNGAQGTTFVERSFLEHGYAPARVIATETTSKNAKN